MIWKIKTTSWEQKGQGGFWALESEKDWGGNRWMSDAGYSRPGGRVGPAGSPA
jgi:hypothetical protein